MKISMVTAAVLSAFVLLAPSQVHAAESAKLQKEAKISMDHAKQIALEHVKKHSKIESSELEREHGKLIYSFDIREPHRKDVTEVNVNAIDGKIVAIDHESPQKESAEKKQEAKEKP